MFNKTIPRGGAGQGGSKKCKSIPAPPRSAGLKSHPIPAPSPLRDGKNPYGEGRVKRSRSKLPSLIVTLYCKHFVVSLAFSFFISNKALKKIFANVLDHQ